MNDPWDVKSVRQPNQYISCMKLNGVPLLPPVLSRECRKEMQYYKLLAKEVEKRISILQPYVISDNESSEDKTDAPEIPEYELPHDDIETAFDVNIDQITAIKEKSFDNSLKEDPVTTDVYQSITSNVTVKTNDSLVDSPKFVIDLSLSFNNANKNLVENKVSRSKTPPSPPLELPEHDCDYKTKPHKELLTDFESVGFKQEFLKDVNFKCNLDDKLSDPFPDIPLRSDGPSSLSSKSFTGSLHDIHTESVKESAPKLIRQRSYTVLKPSPQLLAHLEVQSLNTGVEMSSISMSESLSNINSTNKKRRSWDLESAKVKWSHMALELKRASITGNLKSKINNNTNVNNATNINGQIAKPITHKGPTKSPVRARSVAQDNGTRRGSLNVKPLPKSEPIQKSRSVVTPVKNIPSNKTVVKEPVSPTTKDCDSLKHSPPAISKSEDPASKVRELYEKIQKQQLIQMASLVEKQKREQMLLQQVFEEQNNLLFKQLKTICPKSPVEAKEAWGEKAEDRGPVSLSQLINNDYKSPPQSICDSPVSNTLTETNCYINRCDNVLKKSRDITNNIKKQTPRSRNLNGSKIQTPQSYTDSRTRTHSPTQKNASRKLNYDSAASSDREYEPMLTDRTNDTMADLNNVTFPSDSDEVSFHNTVTSQPKTVKRSPVPPKHSPSFRSTDSAIRSLEDTIQNSMNTMNMICKNTSRMAKQGSSLRPPTVKERDAAARIVAFAKGYLVRRLMSTERVQSTVQTIRDALLCALQLHQDREGIRGADVDLHRRLIQQITAACYNLHDTFVASTPADRCAMIAADRGRRRSLAARQPTGHTPRSLRQTDVMSQSYSGSFPARSKRPSSSVATLMTQSNYETFSGAKCGGGGAARYVASPRRRPWR